MRISEILKNRKKTLFSLSRLRGKSSDTGKVIVCPDCNASFSENQLRKEKYVCPDCNHYFAVTAFDRIDMVCDEGSFIEHNALLKSKNPLDFPDYEKKLQVNRRKTGLNDAVITGTGKIGGIKAAVAVLDQRFLMGSMGTVVGEKITLLTEYAERKKLPLIIFSASGGARMQEGLFSLMQMAKTAQAVERFKERGGLFISYLTNPTTGGVSASYASLGDIIIGEPKALICFAGPRVIEQTIGEKLPEGFQRAEFLLEHGMLDMIVERRNMKSTLVRLLKMH